MVPEGVEALHVETELDEAGVAPVAVLVDLAWLAFEGLHQLNGGIAEELAERAFPGFGMGEQHAAEGTVAAGQVAEIGKGTLDIVHHLVKSQDVAIKLKGTLHMGHPGGDAVDAAAVLAFVIKLFPASHILEDIAPGVGDIKGVFFAGVLQQGTDLHVPFL